MSTQVDHEDILLEAPHGVLPPSPPPPAAAAETNTPSPVAAPPIVHPISIFTPIQQGTGAKLSNKKRFTGNHTGRESTPAAEPAIGLKGDSSVKKPLMTGATGTTPRVIRKQPLFGAQPHRPATPKMVARDGSRTATGEAAHQPSSYAHGGLHAGRTENGTPSPPREGSQPLYSSAKTVELQPMQARHVDPEAAEHAPVTATAPAATAGSTGAKRPAMGSAKHQALPISAAAAYHAKGSSIPVQRSMTAATTPHRRVLPSTTTTKSGVVKSTSNNETAEKREASVPPPPPPSKQRPKVTDYASITINARRSSRTSSQAPSHVRSKTPSNRKLCTPIATSKAAADAATAAQSHNDSVLHNGSQTPKCTTARMSDLAKPSDPSNQSLTRLQQQKAALTGRRSHPVRKSINVSLCKYSLIRKVAAETGYDIQESEDELNLYRFNLCWSDTVLPLTRIVRFGNWQRSNHFPSMFLLCRKGHLGTTLGKMRKNLPTHFGFYPYTWTMRSERAQFLRYYAALRQKKLIKFFIVKPNSGCQGRGIVVTRDPFSSVDDLDNFIVQEYIPRPLLIEGRKFDLRVYVLLTSIREPSIFMFDDGLVRLCTALYEPPTDANAKNACKHLTNYAVNKHSADYVFNTDIDHCDIGNKRNFKFFNAWLTSEGHDAELFWSRVGFVIVKTILAAQPQIRHVYNSCFPRNNDGYSCFEVLGFDILVDSHLKPWLMEVNHTPSLATDTPLDLDIKSRLIRETWDIIGCRAEDYERDRRREREEFARRNMAAPGTARHYPLRSTASPEGAGAQSTTTPHEDGAQEGGKEEVPELVRERRKREDQNLHYYHRIYPTENAEYDVVYNTIRQLAEAQAAATVGTGPVPPPQASLQPQSSTNAERLRRDLRDFSSTGSIQRSTPRSAMVRSRTPVASSSVTKGRTTHPSRAAEGYKKLEIDMERHRRKCDAGAKGTPPPQATAPAAPAATTAEAEAAHPVEEKELAHTPVATTPVKEATTPPAAAGGSPHSAPRAAHHSHSKHRDSSREKSASKKRCSNGSTSMTREELATVAILQHQLEQAEEADPEPDESENYNLDE